MTSFGYHLNPLYRIKECLSSGALYTTDYCCSVGILGDKIICDHDKTHDFSQRSPKNCPKCGRPVDGHYCQGCALLRKKFKEDLFTSGIEHGIFQDSSEPSNDNHNVVNAPREPFVVNQEPGKNSSQINHHCCYGCDDPLEGIFCHQCTCKFCGNGAHYGYNCPPKVLIIPDPEPFNNQTIKELPPTVPSFDPKSELVHDSPNVRPTSATLFLFVDDQSFSDEDFPKEIYSNPLFDEEIISLKTYQHHFNAESDLIEYMLNHDFWIISSSKIDFLFDEFAGELTLLKSIPPGINETDCDAEEETHFIKRLLYDNLSPRPPKEFVSENYDAAIESFSPSPIPVEDSENDSLSLLENKSFHFDIPSFSRPPAKPPDGNTGILNVKMMGDISEQKVPMPRLMITLVPNQDKSHDHLSHQGLEASQLSAECPMIIHRKNTPILDVPLFHFYPA
nr:hypothetical protein [Tanacetum cinerariifolium]